MTSMMSVVVPRADRAAKWREAMQLNVDSIVLSVTINRILISYVSGWSRAIDTALRASAHEAKAKIV